MASKKRERTPPQPGDAATAIKRARELAGHTQRSLAPLLGVSETYIRQVEQGWTGVSLAQLSRIALVTGCVFTIVVDGLSVTYHVEKETDES